MSCVELQMLSFDLCLRNITLFSLAASVVLSVTSLNEPQNTNGETKL